MKIGEYITETKAEMSHVSWPTKKQAISYTVMVILVAAVTSLLLGFFDYIFGRLLTLLF